MTKKNEPLCHDDYFSGKQEVMDHKLISEKKLLLKILVKSFLFTFLGISFDNFAPAVLSNLILMFYGCCWVFFFFKDIKHF